MIISHSKKFIFIHLEKCGGTSVESALQPHLDWGDIIIGGTVYGQSTQDFLFTRYGAQKARNDFLWTHSTARQIYRYLGKDKWKDYQKVVVVRNPVDLAKSLYSFSEKVVSYHSATDYENWKHRVHNRAFTEDWPYGERYVRSFITSHVRGTRFEGFVDDMVVNDYDCFSPYVERIRASVFEKDYGMVVDLSQLNERWGEITDRLGVSGATLEKLNTSRSETLNISPAAVAKIKRRFAIDYERMPEYTGVEWK